MTSFVDPDAAPVHVLIGRRAIRCTPITVTVPVPRPIGDGCVADDWTDMLAWRAEFHGRVATAQTPYDVALKVLGQ